MSETKIDEKPKPAAKPRAPAKPNAKTGEVVAHPAYAETRVARPATKRPRHRFIVASFFVAVVAPSLAAVAYLFALAADQYESRVAFSVRGPDGPQPIELLGALTGGMSGSHPGADAEIIYEFVRSQRMVEIARERLPLEAMFNRPERDVVFRLGEDRPIEDVVSYWNWMTDVAFQSTSGIVHFEVRAFDPESATAIAGLVLDESTRLVNELSTQAREDAISVAREVLAEAEERLREIRRELRAFRDIEQQLDPTEDARAALGLVAALEGELAAAQIDLDTQTTLVGEAGPRVSVLRQRIASLEERIALERARIGVGGRGAGGVDGADPETSRAFADLVAEYEDLVVDREFAQNAYVAALAAYERAQIEARRQTRYLSPHISPTLSAEPQYPQRMFIAIGVFGVLLVAWAVMLLIVYNIRDRR